MGWFWFCVFACSILFQLQIRNTGEALPRTSNSWYISNDKCTVSFLEPNCGHLWRRSWVHLFELVSIQEYFIRVVGVFCFTDQNRPQSKAVSCTVLVKKQCSEEK